MEVVIFVGLQASGKSSFYRERFFDTHVRINLDMLKTRKRESRLVAACLEARQRFVVDNTNPTREDREKYINAAKAARFRVVGYYFRSQVEECQRRNETRKGRQQVPLPGVLATYDRLEIPSRDEGFDALYYVRIDEDGRFVVKKVKGELPRD